MVLKNIEKKLGLPPLSEVAETVNKLPDEKRLKSIKDILILAERVALIAPELDKVVTLVNSISDMPLEKMQEFGKVLKSIEKIIKTAPEDLVQLLAGLKDG